MARGSIFLFIQARYSLHLPRATGQLEVTGQGILTKRQDSTGKDDPVQAAQLKKCFILLQGLSETPLPSRNYRLHGWQINQQEEL